MPDTTSKGRLEPVEKSSTSGPPSLPTVVNGRIGIWRTIRGNRMFIELKGGAFEGVSESSLRSMSDAAKRLRFGKYFDDQGRIRTDQDEFQQGEILDGPAEFVGRDISGVEARDWEKLTPEKTKQIFSRVDVDNKGLSALKSSVRRAISNPNDTRMKRLRTANTAESIIPIARISGFKDDEIKNILTSGKPSENFVESLTIGNGPKEKPEPPTRLSPRQAPEAAISGANAVQVQEVISEMGRSASLRPQALSSILEGLRDSRDDDKFKNEMDKLINRLKVESSEKSVDTIANRAINLVEREIEEEVKGGSRLRLVEPADETKKPPGRLKEDEKSTKESVQNDKKAVQSAVDRVQTDEALGNVAQDFLEDADGDKEKAFQMALEYILGQLESSVRLPQVKREVVRIKEAVSSGRIDRSETLFLLIQILRLILTVLVPV